MTTIIDSPVETIFGLPWTNHRNFYWEVRTPVLLFTILRAGPSYRQWIGYIAAPTKDGGWKTFHSTTRRRTMDSVAIALEDHVRQMMR